MAENDEGRPRPESGPATSTKDILAETPDQRAQRQAREWVNRIDRHHRVCAMLEQRASLVLYNCRRWAA
jgi:hypothetical protein